MAIPILKFKNTSIPYKIRGGERRIIDIEVKPNAVGTTKVKLFLTAPQCSFLGGSKEIIIEFDATNGSAKKLVSFHVVLQGEKPLIYTMKINAQAINADRVKNKIGILTRLDCKKPMVEESEQTVTFEVIEEEPEPMMEEVVVVVASEEAVTEEETKLVDDGEFEKNEEEMNDDTIVSTDTVITPIEPNDEPENN